MALLYSITIEKGSTTYYSRPLVESHYYGFNLEKSRGFRKYQCTNCGTLTITSISAECRAKAN